MLQKVGHACFAIRLFRTAHIGIGHEGHHRSLVTLQHNEFHPVLEGEFSDLLLYPIEIGLNRCGLSCGRVAIQPRRRYVFADHVANHRAAHRLRRGGSRNDVSSSIGGNSRHEWPREPWRCVQGPGRRNHTGTQPQGSRETRQTGHQPDRPDKAQTLIPQDLSQMMHQC